MLFLAGAASSVIGGAWDLLSSLQTEQSVTGDNATNVNPGFSLVNTGPPASSGSSTSTSSASTAYNPLSAGVLGYLILNQSGQSAAPSGSGWTSGSQDNFRQDFGQLAAALKSGDLAGAQQAYAVLSALGSNGQTDSSSPFAQGLSQIGSALQSGDLSGAQQALSSLQAQMQSLRGSYHHHHHGMSGTTDGTSGSGQTDMLGALLSADSSAQGTTTSTTTNADGSNTTTITYADGSTVSTTTPASSTSASVTSSASASASVNQGSTTSGNMLETLIRLQAELLGSSTVSAA